MMERTAQATDCSDFPVVGSREEGFYGGHKRASNQDKNEPAKRSPRNCSEVEMSEPGIKKRCRVSSEDETFRSVSKRHEGEGALVKNSSDKSCCGGVYTSRLSISVPFLSRIFGDVNRIRLVDTRPRVYPEFLGCPDWAKSLMFSQYEVRKEALTQHCCPR
jgi:hypothetical protein